MDLSRRSFLKTGVAGTFGLSALGFDLQPLQAQSSSLKISRTTQTRSTCPYCSVSCGIIIHTLGDRAKNVTPQVVHVEGDPDHPINRGTLCPKGSSLQQDIVNPATGEVLGRVPLSSAAEVGAAVEAAAAAFPGWRRTPPEDRIQYLFKLSRICIRVGHPFAIGLAGTQGNNFYFISSR